MMHEACSVVPSITLNVFLGKSKKKVERKNL